MADETPLTAGRGWQRFTRSIGKTLPRKLAQAQRSARATKALMAGPRKRG